MSPTAPALPAGSALGHSYEYGVDVNLGTVASPSWQSVRRISDVQSAPSPRIQPAQSYDDFGSDNNEVTGWTPNLSFAVLVNRNTSTGEYLPEIQAILDRVKPSAIGDAAVLHARVYHKPASGTPNPDDAYQALFTVTIQRANVGSDGAPERWTVTLAGKGPATEIANPFTGWGAAVPTVTTALPSGQGTGELVTLTGTGFTGTTGITVNAIAATEFTVLGDASLVLALPADTGGTVDIIVTNATGPSAAFSYTRGA